MKKLTGSEIRRIFLDFFAEKAHLIIPGSPLVPENDPTLLYINSGMAPLKPYFMGTQKPPCARLVNYQACIRTRDIDDVGDRHHLTMFEMLGSWSIGDYYKQGAIELAWELLTERFGFPKEKLYFTVYGGNPAINLPPDEESYKAWRSVGVPEDHLVVLGEDNFWGPAGDTGPCGPCTEVFFDTGEEHGEKYVPGKEFDTKKRYIEIWNAGVFMQFNKNADGTFIPLPLKSVDTGSGTERMELAMHGFDSVYEIETLSKILNAAKSMLPSSKLTVKDYRMLTDHLRASSFILAEHVKPANEGQGYVARRLIRKCATVAVKAGASQIDFSPLVEIVIATHKDAYPHLADKKDVICKAMATEIAEFEPVIRRGIAVLEKKLETLKSRNIPGDLAFDLVTTHGIPLEILKGYCEERGLSLDEDQFHQKFEEHRNISRNEKESGDGANAREQEKQFETISRELKETAFEGYEKSQTTATVQSILRDNKPINSVAQGNKAYLVLTNSPFYAESGGQKGDTGIIENGTMKARVLDIQKYNKVFIHEVDILNGSVSVGDKVECKLDANRRLALKQHHSATHLLHAALHKVLGKHATQSGSSVDPHRLRFDFQNNSKVTDEQLLEIENIVNEWIWQNIPMKTTVMDVKSAIASGAIAMFGEKYDSDVRVVNFGEVSTELCGGTHVSKTGDIGAFFITAETSVGKGLRRIEAVAGAAALGFVREKFKVLNQACTVMQTDSAKLIEKIQSMETQLKNAQKAQSENKAKFTYEKLHKFGKDLKLWVGTTSVEGKEFKDVMVECERKHLGDLIVLTNNDGTRVSVMISANKNIAANVPADKLLKKLVVFLEGTGGGNPNFAQGGGKKVGGLEQLLSEAPNIAAEILGNK